MFPDRGGRQRPGRIRGPGALLRSLRALLRRVEKYACHRAATPHETLWAGKLADSLEAALTEAEADPCAQRSLAAVERRAAISCKTPPGVRHAVAAGDSPRRAAPPEGIRAAAEREGGRA